MSGHGDGYHGYHGWLASRLRGLGAEPGSIIAVERRDGRRFQGVLMPRYTASDEAIVVLKLPNGYNVGVRVEPGDLIRVVGSVERRSPGAPAPLVEDVERGDARVFILGAGGTVASRVDYETGAVKPYLSAEELVASIPEMLRYASVEAEQVFSILSEDMKPGMWRVIVGEVEKRLRRGYDGVVVTHGTDTMGYTAAALSFAFHKGLPAPIVLTGAQRSSDRPSSDAALNLISSVLTAAKAPFAEVVVVMHGETGDTYALAHRGTRVRKMHTSRRDAFQSINARPLARIWPLEGRIELLGESYRRRGGDLVVENGFDEKVALIKHFPGGISEVIHALVDRGFHGIVVEGTGFGHVSSDAIDAIRRATEEGIPVVVASQTINGRVNLNVYSTGRKMLEAGVIPVEDMLAETAYVKLSWVLDKTRDMREVRRLMTANLAGEISSRHDIALYRIPGA